MQLAGGSAQNDTPSKAITPTKIHTYVSNFPDRRDSFPAAVWVGVAKVTRPTHTLARENVS